MTISIHIRLLAECSSSQMDWLLFIVTISRLLIFGHKGTNNQSRLSENTDAQESTLLLPIVPTVPSCKVQRSRNSIFLRLLAKVRYQLSNA